MITGKYIRELRESAGLSQTELARLANISQAHVAKIETEKVNPRLSTINSVLAVLKKRKKDTLCGDIMSRKLIPLRPGDTAKKAISLMRNFDISQLPVMDKEKVIGSISENTIIKHMGKNPVHIKIREIMDAPFPMVSESDPVEILPELLNFRQAVLVAKDGKVTGIITKFNLIQA